MSLCYFEEMNSIKSLLFLAFAQYEKQQALSPIVVDRS